jgi:hypothetical protein
MKFEEVLGNLRKGMTATLGDLPGTYYVYKNNKLVQVVEKSEKEFVQIENYLQSDKWELMGELSDSQSVDLALLKSAWDSVIVPDSNFGKSDTSSKFMAFAKALGY